MTMQGLYDSNPPPSPSQFLCSVCISVGHFKMTKDNNCSLMHEALPKQTEMLVFLTETNWRRLLFQARHNTICPTQHISFTAIWAVCVIPMSSISICISAVDMCSQPPNAVLKSQVQYSGLYHDNHEVGGRALHVFSCLLSDGTVKSVWQNSHVRGSRPKCAAMWSGWDIQSAWSASLTSKMNTNF